MDIKSQVENFKGLPYEAKKNKVKEMLRQLQEAHEIFAKFYQTLTTINKISDTVLVYLYQSILEIANEIEVGRKEEAQNKIKKMSKVLMAIKKQEEIEMEEEGDLDNILNQI